MRSLRERWGPGKVTLGGWCAIASPFAAEVLGHAGYDWVCIDLQHGLIGYEPMLAMLQALTASETPALVRVADSDAAQIMRVLDAGAAGVVVPLVDSAQQADSAVRACRYPPQGDRSWGPVRASLLDREFSPEKANRDVICVVMVETPAAVSNIDAILEVPGVDGVLVGRNDLALSSGVPLSMADSSAQTQLVLSVKDACRRHLVVAGVAVGDTKSALRWLSAGFEMIALPSDVALIAQGARATLAALREAGGSSAEGRQANDSVDV